MRGSTGGMVVTTVAIAVVPLTFVEPRRASPPGRSFIRAEMLGLFGSAGLAGLGLLAGLLHTGRTLSLPPAARLSFALLLAAAPLRVAPDLALSVALPGGHHAAAAVAWALAFLTWLCGYWPMLRDRRTVGRRAC
jgi:uncharacterized protein involved in response to NO